MNSRRYLGTAAALFTAAIVGTSTTSTQASSFDFDQYVGITGDVTGWGSQNGIYNYDSGEYSVTPYTVGDYFAYYPMPFDARIGIFHYSWAHNAYVEAMYIDDYAL